MNLRERLRIGFGDSVRILTSTWWRCVHHIVCEDAADELRQIEAKIGILLDRNTGGRFGLPVPIETSAYISSCVSTSWLMIPAVVMDDSGLRFESNMTVVRTLLLVSRRNLINYIDRINTSTLTDCSTRVSKHPLRQTTRNRQFDTRTLAKWIPFIRCKEIAKSE